MHIKKIAFIILSVSILKFFMFSADDIDPNEILLIINNIENRISELSNKNSDTTLDETISSLKSKIENYISEEKKIPINDEETSRLVTDLARRVDELIYLNSDNDLKLAIYYLNSRLLKKDIKKLPDNEKKEIKKLEDEIKKIFGITTEEFDLDEVFKLFEERNKRKNQSDTESYKLFIKYFIVRILYLEKEINNLKDSGGSGAELDKKIKQLGTMEKQLDKLLDILIENKTNVEVNKILKELREEDTKINEKLELLLLDKDTLQKILLNPINKNQWGKQFSFQISLGLTGVYTIITGGVMFPKIANLCTIGLLFNYGISIPGTFVAETFRTAMVGGSLYFSISSPVFATFIRIYAALEGYLGYTYSLTDNDLFGKNLAMGVFGLGGMEFYFLRQLAFFVEAGGGILYTHSFEDDLNTNSARLYAINRNNNNGTGIRLNFGMRIYVASNKSKK